MRFIRAILIAATVLVLVSACSHPGQNRYMEAEVGKTRTITFGTIISVRSIEIQGESTGVGAALGATGGAGSVAAASDSVAGAVAAGVVGAVIGAAIEEQAQRRMGVEYVVTLETGLTITLAQNLNKGDRILEPGERVFVQNYGEYQRVLPASNLPTEVKRPRGIKVVD